MSNRSRISRRSLLAGMLAGVASPVLARAPERSPLPPARPASVSATPAPSAAAGGQGSLQALLARSGVSGETGVIALDAETGAVIEEHRAELRLPPASTAKAVTAAYALSTLGAAHRFATRVEARGGAIADGVLNGDLVLRGGGDPVLHTADLARLADALIARGLRRVEGRFWVDDGALPVISHIDRSQPVAAGYNPAVAGINLNFNRVNFVWEVRGGRASLSMDARSEREVPPVSVIDIRAVSRASPVYTHDVQRDGERWTVAAGVLGRPGSRWLPVRLPALYAGDVLRALLLARGCRVPQPRVGNPGAGTVLAEHLSDPLPSILQGMLRYSTNLTAECVGLAASQRLGGTVRALEPSAERMSAWAAERHAATGLALVDHSGLGVGSRVSARSLARFMQSAWADGALPGLLRDHPMRDPQGAELRDHPVSVQAKTGTLNFVSALTGYARRRGGRPIVFAILSADMAQRRAIRDDDRERPSGTRTFAGRARSLQQDLIERWSTLHG